MKNILRWIAVLPGAVAAMIIVNIINGWTVAVIFPDVVDECCKAWFGSIAFILAAYYIAPKGKAITAIVLASVYCGVGLFAVVLALESGKAEHPMWLEILTTVITILASVAATVIAYSFENKQDE